MAYPSINNNESFMQTNETNNSLNKVTFFDDVHITFANNEYYDDLTDTQMFEGGIYFSPVSYSELPNTPHHIAHKNRIYTLGPDVSVTNNGVINVANINTSEPNAQLTPANNLNVITNINADRFKKILNITTQSIDFSKLVNVINQLNTRVATLEEQLQIQNNKTVVSIITTPTIINNLKYTGNIQQLVSPGALNIHEGATILYATSENGEFSETIPTCTNAGQYNIYYKINIIDNQQYIGPSTVFGPITTNINKAELHVIWPAVITDNVVTGSPIELFTGGSITLNGSNVNNSIAEFEYATSDNPDEYSTNVPTKISIGNYECYCKVNLKDNMNYVLNTTENTITRIATIIHEVDYTIYSGTKCENEIVNESSSKLITNKSDITDESFSSYKNYAIRIGTATSISMHIPFKVYITTLDDKCCPAGESFQSDAGVYGYSLSGNGLNQQGADSDVEILIVKQNI